MLKRKQIITTIAAVVLTGSVGASPGEYEHREYYERRGPMPFELLDRNGDGVVSSDEHSQVRQERHAYRAGQGYPLRRANSAPDFAELDEDADGALSRDEFAAWQQQRRQQRQLTGGRGRSAE